MDGKTRYLLLFADQPGMALSVGLPDKLLGWDGPLTENAWLAGGAKR
jgi:hypothetical protein